MNKNKEITSFSCVPYSFEQISPLISKGRLRLFYLGLNRNGGFITKEYAEQKLLPSLPGAPIIGDYDEEENDFTTHIRDRNVRKAYGFVPTEANVTWEGHLDPDGVNRVYACCDVYLWTGRYKAAKEIIGKPHSLELMPETIKGSWKRVEGYKEGFVYTDGVFLGLSVLGEDVEPCFEGSAFYELLTQFNLFMQANNKKTGGIEEMINYRLKNDEKYASLFSAINPNFTEEGQWAYELEIVNYSEDTILAFNPVEGTFSLIPYAANEEGAFTFENAVPVVVQSYGKEDFDSWIEFTGKFEDGSFKGVMSNYSAIEEDLAAKSEALNGKEEEISHLNEDLETLKEEKSTLESEKVELENLLATSKSEKETLEQEKASLLEELENLKAEKAAFELKQKEAKLNNFREFISETSFEDIKGRLESFSMIELEKELAYFSIKDKPELLNNHYTLINGSKEELFTNSKSDVENILDKYK